MKDKLIKKLKDLINFWEEIYIYSIVFLSPKQQEVKKKIYDAIVSLETELSEQKPINGEMDIQNFKDKYGLVYDDIETAIRNYVNGKQELSEQKPEKTADVNFIQIRDLTDEEWLKLPKEEILQLYKNCYDMLLKYVQKPKDNFEQLIDRFFNDTPKDEIKRILKKYDDMTFEGVTIKEYAQQFQKPEIISEE